MNNKNSISVICPFHNNEETIVRAAKSIFAQTLAPNEIIFVNDNSFDRSLEKLIEFLNENTNQILIQIISINHSGPGHARNVAIERSSSNWISFLDADDYWMPEKIRNIDNIIRKDNNVNFTAHDEFTQNNKSEIINSKLSQYFDNEEKISTQIYKRNFLSTSSCTVSKLLIEKYLFDPFLTSCQDYELWLALSSKMKLVFVPKPLCFYDNSLKSSITNSNQTKRFKNLLIVLFRYSEYVSFPLFCFIVSKHLLVFILSSFKK